MTGLLAEAIALAAQAHRGQVDKAGEPYVLHPLRVMFRIREAGHRPEVQAAAALHDVVEDTPVTLEDIAATISLEVAVLVDAVTRRHGEAYEDFVRRAAESPEARAIKMADVEDNLSRIGQLAEVSPELAARLEGRYRKALSVLRGIGPETLDILGDPEAMAALRESLEDVKRGRLVDHAEVRRRLVLSRKRPSI